MKIIGRSQIAHVFHGSKESFRSFDHSRLKSLGFHFGDLAQAEYFAGQTGFIYSATLSFTNLVDIGPTDWGWISAPFIAHAFHTTCVLSGISTCTEDFVQLLGPLPWCSAVTSSRKMISHEEQLQLIDLFRSYGFDGVQYVNLYEPPDSPGGTAYFVLSPDQISLDEVNPSLS